MLRELPDFLRVEIREMPGFVRVNAHRSINPIVTFGDGQRRIQTIGARASARHQNVTKAGVSGAINHRRAVRVKVGVVKVRMRIDEHRCQVPGVRCQGTRVALSAY